MPLFTSKREKRLWIWIFVIVGTIYSTLGIAKPVSNLLREHALLAPFFILGMFLVCMTILTQGFKRRIGKIDLGLAIGVVAIYLMIFVRIEIPEERTHLIEYGVLAIFIFEALKERKSQGKRIFSPAILGMLITSLLGLIDECIQLFLPHRVFDVRDIVFNTLAGVMAIGLSVGIEWIRGRIG